jgi:hypothetical protein
MPLPPFRAVLVSLALFTLAACHDPGAAYERPSVSNAEALERVQRNPAPTKGHRIIVSVEGAPGPLTHAEATAHYSGVDSYGCRYPTTGLGTFSVPNPRVPVPVTRLPDGRFELTVYDDALLATDLFGTGVCEWMTAGPTIWLAADNDADATTLVINILGRDFRERLPATHFFWRGDFPTPGSPKRSVGGIVDRERFGAQVQDELFTITATVAESQP